MKIWNIKAFYASGDHYVKDEYGNKLRFESKQDAVNKAEMLTADFRKIKDPRVIHNYIVVEES